MKTLFTVLTCIAVLAFSASAADTLELRNGSFESNAGGFEGPLEWGPSGGCATHASFSQPGYTPAMGNIFCFMSSYTAETVGQIVTNITQGTFHAITAGDRYDFTCWAIGGSGGAGKHVIMQIGYSTNSTSGVYSPDTFVTLASEELALDTSWTNLYSVSYIATSGPEVGKELAVRYGGVNTGASGDDVWFDAGTISLIPEPTFLAILPLALLFFRRK